MRFIAFANCLCGCVDEILKRDYRWRAFVSRGIEISLNDDLRKDRLGIFRSLKKVICVLMD